ncbi:hypothetical protein HAPAU_23880 [Halalkalicoccus paucihalophilus]|uniref:Uncharacterized protein n=1 Tax=Halalkalicoccus paucihalophilus TaxID=1008153 RepID=A0A151ADR5_9EURY|nr:hypothetical protein [Halalkalicoccus paucihalophilus]KYH25710.1 hypothetical protein HAPAU_23880 [Halalkalicoccus paucihalophilus]
MTDGSVGRGADADERAWRTLVERRVAADHDCTQLAGNLAASRRTFESGTEPTGSSRRRWAIRGLVLLAIPLIVYSELTTPTGVVNYSGMGIGVVLMLAGGLAYL